MRATGKEIYQKLKRKRIEFDEKVHCAMILDVMMNPEKGTFSAFCKEALIGESKFYDWLRANELFFECYALGKMFAREDWEQLGREVREEVNLPGTTNNKFGYWQMIGWSRFGISKNSRIRLTLDANATPNQHYSQLLKQAANGDFTAGEIKQLMEAVNVGLNTHQVFTLQAEIDQLRKDLITMQENTNGNNTFADQGITKED